MQELELKYGCNPNQKPSKIFMKNGKELTYTVKENGSEINKNNNIFSATFKTHS